MAWYNSQLLGVIVGGFIGGFGRIIYEFVNNRRLKRNLSKGIKCEIKVLVDWVNSGIEQYEGYFKQIKDNGRIKTLYKSTGVLSLSFLDNNIEKIGILDESILVPIIEIKGILDILEDNLNLLHETANKDFEGDESSITIVMRQLRMAIATFKKLLELGEEVLKPEKKLISSSWEKFRAKIR